MIKKNFKMFIKSMKINMGDDFMKQYLRYVKYKNWYETLLKRQTFDIPNNGQSIYWLIYTLDVICGFKVQWSHFFKTCSIEDIDVFFNKTVSENYFAYMRFHSPSMYDQIKNNYVKEKNN